MRPGLPKLLLATGLAAGAGHAMAGDAALERSVDFEWPAVPEAADYELEIEPEVTADADAETRRIDSGQNRWNGTLPVGAYRIRIRSRDRRGVPGAWSQAVPMRLSFPAVTGISPAEAAEVRADADERATVNLRWEPLGAGAHYDVVVATETGKVIKKTRTDAASLAVELPVSRRFQWRVTGVLEDGSGGTPWEAPRSFTVLGAPPASPEIDEDVDPEAPVVIWNRPRFAKSFQVTLKHRPDGAPGTAWRTIHADADRSSTKLAFAKDWPEGEYRVEVAAAAPLRGVSEPAVHEFATGLKAALAARKRNTHIRSVGYGWQPAYRAITIENSSGGTTVGSQFQNFVLNSHALELAWVWRPMPFMVGVEAQARYTRSLMFTDNSTTEGVGAQTPITLTTLDPGAAVRAGLGFWRLGLSLAIGAERRALYALYPVSLETFAADSARVNAVTLGPVAELLLDGGAVIALSTDSARATTQAGISNFSADAVTLALSHPTFIGNFMIRYFATRDRVAFDFAHPGTGEPWRSTWDEFILGVGAAIYF